MPEMRFRIRWPDGTAETCYSPSLVIREHLSVGETYDVAEFMRRSRTALTIASDRRAEPAEPASNRRPPNPLSSTSTTGVPAKPGAVVPSMLI